MDHRSRALRSAARSARLWTEEAADLAETGRSLTELRSVGPWVAAHIYRWLEEPPAMPERDETRVGYLTMAQARKVLDQDPSWEATPHADLQVHSTDSDGSLPFRDMALAARDLGRTFIAITDHSKSLRIARGMDEERLADQGRRIEAFNHVRLVAGDGFRVLRSIEMDVFPNGKGDMDPPALAPLDLVLGAFHTKLRVNEDQTERYLATLRNPTVSILAHPKARMFGRRIGLRADWSRVFEEPPSPARRSSLMPRRLGRTLASNSHGSPWQAAFDGSPSGATPTRSLNSALYPSGWQPRSWLASLASGS